MQSGLAVNVGTLSFKISLLPIGVENKKRNSFSAGNCSSSNDKVQRAATRRHKTCLWIFVTYTRLNTFVFSSHIQAVIIVLSARNYNPDDCTFLARSYLDSVDHLRSTGNDAEHVTIQIQ
jgi:hypothetical protein